jgi:hypothetical protein
MINYIYCKHKALFAKSVTLLIQGNESLVVTRIFSLINAISVYDSMAARLLPH